MFLTSLRKRGQTIAEILFACAFIGLFLGLRYILDRRFLKDTQIDRFTPQHSLIINESTANVTYYYPSLPLSKESLSSFSNEMLLSINAYIIFTNMDSCVNKSTMPDQVHYTLRMQENGLSYYRAHRVKLKDSEIRSKRSPEDFCHALLAKMLGFLLWFFTFIDFYPNVPVGALYVLCLFPNIGLMFCVQVMLQFERKGDGTTTFSRLYSNLFTSPLYIGICLLLMLVYSFIYMILAIYIERISPGGFGISQPWNYLCKKGYWKSRQASSMKHNKNKDQMDSIAENNHWIESSSFANTKLPILSINHMTKKFGKLNAVMDLSLDFYNGEVCSLLGHNGAGKTTTTFILVDILYNELSVREHLKLVAEMRQMKKKEVKESIDNILNLIGLVDQQYTWAKNLSGGMKRRLSIGISLVGNPKVLILDEPTSGIDPYNRRFIWTIIRKMKEAGKCIIMTTHFLEEADVLSDRIAVMTKGRLQANGTPEFLKQQTDFEYRIFIDKNETCDIQQVTQFFQEHVQTAVLERQSASELVFGIKRGVSQRISGLINTLDEQGSNIGIKGYGLSMTTVEEVFLKLVEEEEEEEEEKTNEIKNHQEKPKANLAKTVFHRNHNHITGFYLIWIRLCTLIIKRWILSRRQIFVLLGFFLGPLLIEIITISALPSPKDIQSSLLQNERIKDAQVTLLPSIYNPQTIVIYSNEVDNQIKGYLKNYLTNMGANIDEIPTNNILDYVLSRNNVSYDTYVNKYQMGFSIDRRGTWPTLNVYFSTVNYHTIATSLSVATTCLFQYFSKSSLKSIQTINQPILTSSTSVTARSIFFDRIYCFDTVPLSLLNFINSFIASIFISILALNVIRERISHSKDLQLLTNTSKKLYWFSNFLYDLTLCLILSAILTIVVKVR
ncbi:unnamed protein product [Rotaria sp. Silwood1]|nr:unnamed protein product [Rotaria sp. Silwood1]